MIDTYGSSVQKHLAKHRGLIKSGLAFVVIGAAALLLSGCMAEVATPGPVYADDVVDATYVPPDIYDYPSVYYDGGYAYFVDGQWYYPEGSGWVIFQHEPAELAHYRHEHEGQWGRRGMRHAANPVIVAPSHDERENRMGPAPFGPNRMMRVGRLEPAPIRPSESGYHAQFGRAEPSAHIVWADHAQLRPRAVIAPLRAPEIRAERREPARAWPNSHGRRR